LLKAGLTDKQSVKEVRKQKQKQAKKPKDQRGEMSESARQAEQTRLEKARRDKELNRQRQQSADNKAQLAQIKQLVQHSKINREDGELAYNFTLHGKIKKIYVTEDQQKQLARNHIAIVSLSNDQFELVPRLVADKIMQRDAAYVIKQKDEEVVDAHDDPYADYQIPDDLVW